MPILFAWSDEHLYCFRIHGNEYGSMRPGGPRFDQAEHRLDWFPVTMRVTVLQQTAAEEGTVLAEAALDANGEAVGPM
jgi:hypothetical protein